MMGRTATAIITFEGSYIPREVVFAGGVYRCFPHRPRAQFRTNCLAIGHRADVCQRSGQPRCPRCGQDITDIADHQECVARCTNCGGNHGADDITCEVRREADKAVRQMAYQKRVHQRNMLQKTQEENHKPLKIDHRPRSRSRVRGTERRSPSNARRSQSRPRLGGGSAVTATLQVGQPSVTPLHTTPTPKEAARSYRNILMHTKPKADTVYTTLTQARPAVTPPQPQEMETHTATTASTPLGSTENQEMEMHTAPTNSDVSPKPKRCRSLTSDSTTEMADLKLELQVIAQKQTELEQTIENAIQRKIEALIPAIVEKVIEILTPLIITQIRRIYKASQ
ncbi:hypothetical protein HPB48_018793 [Haemaphysalis longicornis]|uniref:Uncharacterized protein n=1 Tax=Haemaphysalis longicornis TaxID=44386 RepID=A0A9J6G308_HAELO|nr:hypothetical protein HPB48_018793 [Haemaphysalis longicornis]